MHDAHEAKLRSEIQECDELIKDKTKERYVRANAYRMRDTLLWVLANYIEKRKAS